MGSRGCSGFGGGVGVLYNAMISDFLGFLLLGSRTALWNTCDSRVGEVAGCSLAVTSVAGNNDWLN